MDEALDGTCYTVVILAGHLAGTFAAAVGVETPIVRIVVPHDGGESKDFFCDRSDSCVDIALWRTPGGWDVPALVVDDPVDEKVVQLPIGNQSVRWTCGHM